MVLLEVLIDPTCSIVLERQPAENDIMERRPRNAEDVYKRQVCPSPHNTGE